MDLIPVSKSNDLRHFMRASKSIPYKGIELQFDSIKVPF